MKRYLIRTLGCKVNQCESVAIGCSLEKAGLKRASKDQVPDLVVINTCAVTGRAAMQSRQSIRQTARQFPAARIVVTGCYAQVGHKEIESISGADIIVGHDRKLAVAQWLPLTQGMPETMPVLTRTPPQPMVFAPLSSAADRQRTRAFLKIQDGCNTRCTYCIVPLARGSSRSMPVNDVMTHMGDLGSRHFKEVVLTGIHLGVYGIDLTPPTCLTALLDGVIAKAFVPRIRLSSIEPMEITPRLIQLMAAADSSLCRHLHIPLQSGDNTILDRMGRGYTREAFAQVVLDCRLQIPDAAIGIDVLVGFPGEDDQAFQNTFDLIASLPATYLHVFPYSPRPGTPAAKFDNHVPQRIVKKRCEALRKMGEEKRKHFYGGRIGTRTKVLVETTRDKHTGMPKGTSGNYLPVTVLAEGLKENSLVEVEIEGFGKGGSLLGRPIVYKKN